MVVGGGKKKEVFFLSLVETLVSFLQVQIFLFFGG